MSCSGCRVLRKGCSDVCVLRPSIGWIDGSEAQGHATVFVAKFVGRAGLLSSLSSTPESHRPALFRSLLYEACGRAVNPISGAVGLLWSGNWDECEAAVEAVLSGGIPRPMAEADCIMGGLYGLKTWDKSCDLDLRLSSMSPAERAGTASDESGVTSTEGDGDRLLVERPRLLNLFA